MTSPTTSIPASSSPFLPRLVLCLTLLLLLLAPAPNCAQPVSPSPSPSPSNLPVRPKNIAEDPRFDRHFYLSDDAPVTAEIQRPLAAEISRLVAFVSHVERAVVNATTGVASTSSISDDNSNEQDQQQQRDGPVLTTCNFRVDTWKRDLEVYYLQRNWPIPDTSCISDIYGAGREVGGQDISADPLFASVDVPATASQVYDAVTTHSRSVDQRASAIVQRALPPDQTTTSSRWKQPTRSHNFQYAVRDQACTYDYTGFVKLGSRWHIAERLTNDDKTIVHDDGNRLFLYEYVAESGAPLAMRVPCCADNYLDATENNNNNGQSVVLDVNSTRSNVSTALGVFSASVEGSAFGNMYAKDNLAVEEALRRGEHQTQQASDATTPSNVAILIFPLVMNAVPVALIADVNSAGMLLYTLLTDVLTAVPLAIKGVEVLLIGRRRNRAVVTRITGGNLADDFVENVNAGDDDESGAQRIPVSRAAELWVAQCRPTGSLTATGVALLTVALVSMVLGVAAEFWAKRWVRLRKQQTNAAFMQQQQHRTRHGGVDASFGEVEPLSGASGLSATMSGSGTMTASGVGPGIHGSFAGANIHAHGGIGVGGSGVGGVGNGLVSGGASGGVVGLGSGANASSGINSTMLITGAGGVRTGAMGEPGRGGGGPGESHLSMGDGGGVVLGARGAQPLDGLKRE